jgi:hypothetical protein
VPRRVVAGPEDANGSGGGGGEAQADHAGPQPRSRGEIRELRWRDVDWAKRMIHLPSLKLGRHRRFARDDVLAFVERQRVGR